MDREKRRGKRDCEESKRVTTSGSWQILECQISSLGWWWLAIKHVPTYKSSPISFGYKIALVVYSYYKIANINFIYYYNCL